MTYYGGKDLAASFRTVRANTIKIAEDIPESQYSFKAAPDIRSIGTLLVHIGLGPTFQTFMHQNKIDDLTKANLAERMAELMAKVSGEEAKPRSKAEIIGFLKSEGETFAAYLEGLPESFLAEQVKMPPHAQPLTKSRFEMLLSAKEHEMHHRGQLMIVERLLGIVPHLTRQYQERMAAQQAQR
jgi:uncharacterized damage-inducible protein DinB